MNIRRIVSNVIILILICQSFVTNIYASEIRLTINGVEQQLQTSPYLIDNVTFVDVNEVFTLLGTKTTFDDVLGQVTAIKNNKTIVISAEFLNAKVDGVSVPLPAKPFMQDGKLMGPLRFITDTLGIDLVWSKANVDLSYIELSYNEATYNMSLTQNEADLQPGEINILNIKMQGEEGSTILSYQEALDKAIKNNNSLQTLTETLNYIDEQYEQTDNDYFISLTSGNDMAQRSYLRALVQMSQQIDNKSLNEKLIKGSTEYLLKNSLKTIAESQMDRQLLDENIKLAEVNIQNLNLKLSLGMVSQNEVKQAQQNYEQSLTNLEMLDLVIADEKLVLNNLLGYKPKDKIIVDFAPVFEAFEYDLELAIKRISSDPSILLKKSAVDIAEYNLDTSYTTVTEAMMMNRTGSSTPSESKLDLTNKYNQAKRDYDDAKINMEKTMRTTYNNILKLEVTQKSLELDLEKAIDAFNTAVVSFNAGMITQYEVNLSKLGILNAEIAIAKNLYTLENLKFMIQNPYLLSSAQG